MTAAAVETNELQHTTGFVVESAAGDTGWVEDVWLGDSDEPCALAVQTVDGRRALLLSEDVLAVDREHHWVVISPELELLELDAPRLSNGRAGHRLAASWGTTGAVLPAPSRPHWRLPRPRARSAHRPPREQLGPPAVTQVGKGRAFWKTVLILYGSIALIAVALIALAFAAARLFAGSAY